MAKIHNLKISNFKGLKRFEQVFGITDFICLIGRGDSGKTTILEAISAVLSPNWNLSFYDSDFHNGDISNPIEIEVSLYDLPATLIRESKFGLFIRGLNVKTNKISDEIEDDHVSILTVKLIVDKNLEPKWYVINKRESQQPIEIRTGDRASLNVFLISDYVDGHFSWSRGNPLNALLKEEETTTEKSNVLIDAFREAKEKIDSTSFSHLDNVVQKIKLSATALGVDINDTQTTIDFKNIALKDGRISLHDHTVPFRLKGKGSKRLISIAIQLEVAKTGGILLIDEIEQGLEPDRAQHLARVLKKKNKGQVFITTHSRDVLVELTAGDVFKMKKGNINLHSFDSSLQGCIRRNPEAFFSERVLVCEGATEVGICRGINNFRIEKGDPNAALLGIRFADGQGGSNHVEYAKAFKKSGYDVSLFCDSDVPEINKVKPKLVELGIRVIDCENSKSIENHLFEDLPWEAVLSLVQYRIKEKGESSVQDSIEWRYDGDFPYQWRSNDHPAIRDAIYQASVTKKKEWFKRTDHGEFVGRIICENSDAIKEKKLGQIFQELSNWMENV
ncbi:ATP-dependent nuclease [Salinimicrobium xinjiangense]|uniref:ATP-dependent nuclease n=1 Tax=Salinimicrobium xinjiangense TaxID=438596 RepID=UPI0004208759|nr:ATP-binding protein [Salinimicrobium xinjiangense]